jgi:MYND finger
MADKCLDGEKTCASCEKVLHGKILNCSACQQTCYCNADCQKNHWPRHKIRCQQMQQGKQAAIANNQKHLHKLLLEWKNECREIMMDYCLLGYFGKDAMASVEPEPHMICFKLAFDYNYHTFVPIEPPTIAPVDDAASSEQDAEQIHRLYDEAKQMLAQPPSNLPSSIRNGTFAPAISYIEYIGGHDKSDRQVLIHTNMLDLDDDDDDDVPENVSFEDMVYEL